MVLTDFDKLKHASLFKILAQDNHSFILISPMKAVPVVIFQAGNRNPLVESVRHLHAMRTQGGGVLGTHRFLKSCSFQLRRIRTVDLFWATQIGVVPQN